MPNELPYKELIKTCALLGVYVERLAKQIKAQDETILFLIGEVLKVEAEIYCVSRKTPWKRFNELEESITGMNTYYQEKLAELQASKRKKEDTY